uniref:Zinc knuckle CX2CX4HX4C domain-containing protein n=1 Tax=Cannabis sativa TaxID=3483 RepID=A0A803PSQ2_CANSA
MVEIFKSGYCSSVLVSNLSVIGAVMVVDGGYGDVVVTVITLTFAPLLRGTGFHFHGMAAPVWLEFRFKNLPDFCHYCGRLSHIMNHYYEFLAKCDSSSAPHLLRYDQSLGAKIRITLNPFYIACLRTRLRPHIANPTSLAPTPHYRLHQPPIISEGLFNEPTSAYGVQQLSKPQTTPMGFYMAHSSPNVLTSHTHNLNQPTLPTTTWLYPPAPVTATQTAHTQGESNFLTQTNTIPTSSSPSPPITTTEQLTIPLPKAISTSAETIVATNGAPQHVVPVSQAFSTILADLNLIQPLRFVIGAPSNPAPTTSGIRKNRPKRTDCLNAAEFRKMLKRTHNLSKSLDEETVEEAGDAHRTRLEP